MQTTDRNDHIAAGESWLILGIIVAVLLAAAFTVAGA